MKKMLSLFMSSFIVLASFSFLLEAAALQSEDIPKTRIGSSSTYYEFDAETKTLTISGSGATPNMMSNGSAQPWLDWRSDGSIERVVVEEGITSLGNYCLYQVCAKSVSYPMSLRSIGRYSMAYMTKLTEAQVPFGSLSIGQYAFAYCAKLADISLPDTLVTVENYAFSNCSSLESVTVPYSVNSIGIRAFYNCSSLSYVRFQSDTMNVKIGDYAFLNCQNLKNVRVPENAELGVQCLGYSGGSIMGTFSMEVFASSNAHIYAEINGASYNLLDAYTLECSVPNDFRYENATKNKTITLDFIAESSISYNFYSSGNCDIKASLLDSSGVIVAENDDISVSDFNFRITAKLTEGEQYQLNIASVNSVGDFIITAYPSEIVSAEVYGSLSFTANSDGHFDITDDMLSDFVIKVNFDGDYSDLVYYSQGSVNKNEITISDIHEPFTCGNNIAYIKVGDITAPFYVEIEHNFTSKDVPYTLYEDGYTLYSCVLCDYNYKDNYIKTPAVTVSGKCVLLQNPHGAHDRNIPYTFASLTVDGREYAVNENGDWSFNTFDDCEVIFNNPYGKNAVIEIDVEDDDVYFGELALSGFDLNSDGHVNGRDYVYYRTVFSDRINREYWSFWGNFI